MDENGFAAKSQKLQINDRILACNGVDFTKEPHKRWRGRGGDKRERGRERERERRADEGTQSDE